MITGTAYAGGSGGGSFGVGGSGSQAGWSNVPAANAVNEASNNLNEAAEKLSDTLSGYIDWIERVFDRLSREYEHIMSQMERIAHLPDKQAKLYEAMSKNQEKMNATQQAIARYQSHVNWLGQQSGLNPTIIGQIQNGSMDISKYDDETQSLVKEYQSYYDKLVDMNAQYDELLSKQDELVRTALENVEEYIDMMTGIELSAVDYQEAYRELMTSRGESAYSDAMIKSFQETIQNQKDASGKIQSQVQMYQDEINKLMANGTMAKYSTEWYEAQAELNKLRQEAAESANALIEFQDQLRELDYQKMQDVIDALERNAERLANSVDWTEAKGEDVSEADLQKQLKNENEQINANYNKRKALLKEQGLYDVGSERYNEIAEEIAKLDNEIYDSLGNIEELKNKIWEVRWDPFFKGQEALSDLISETDDLRGLLNEDAFIGKNGGLTTEGIANLVLISQGMNAAKQQIRDYQEAIKKLDKDLENGNISTAEYEEQQKDFLNQIRDSVGVVEDYKDSIIDLWKSQLKAENDVIQDSIDKHKELLDAKKANDEYSSNVRKQTKDINALKAQISALSGVNNEAAKAERKRLEQQLRDAEEQLNDTRKDHEYDVRNEGYDGLSDDLNQALEDTLDEVTYNAEMQEKVISEMLNHVVNNYKEAYDKIQSIIDGSGFVPSGDLNDNLGNLGSQGGAQDQINDSNTNAPDYNPSDSVSDINTGQIQDSGSKNNNDNIENIIGKEPNTGNRPVAELKLSKTSVSLQEGQSTTITAKIRPNDAKNKKLNWKSSNTKVATVQNGTVKAVKPGSATITASTTDGSGLSASCGITVTKKPEPPKPQPKPPQNQNNGTNDGVARVGDPVKFNSGNYYYSSDGLNPSGNEMLGQTVYITQINDAAWATKKYHIARDKAGSRPLGWVSLDQISGYAKGTEQIKNAIELAKVDEMGKELRIKRGGNIYEMFHYGDGVVPADLTKNLFTLAQNKDELMNGIRNNFSGGNIVNRTEIHYDSMLTINGDIDKDTFPGVKKMCEEAYKYTTQELSKDAKFMGIRRKL